MKILKLEKNCLHGTHKIQLLNNKEFFATKFRGRLLCEELFLADIVKYNPLDISENLSMRLEDGNEVRVGDFSLSCIDKEKEELSITFWFCWGRYLESNDLICAPVKFIRAIKKEARNFENFSIPYYREDGGEGVAGLDIKIKTPYLKSILSCIKYAKQQLRKLLCQAKIQLQSFNWNPHYEKNEQYFSLELLIPLFQKMGFENISYNHGKDEYGKDITFQEIDKLGIRKTYGVQVKAGNISGKINSSIDSLISQIDDAFKVPFIDLNSRNPQYISTLIVVCSGHFTHNAKEKIQYKLSQGLYGSVNFLDKNKIQELIGKYWIRK